jgi:hypothetical protein
LARSLGKTVCELRRSIGSHELSEWIAFFNVENDKQREAYLKNKAEASVNQIKRGRKRVHRSIPHH